MTRTDPTPRPSSDPARRSGYRNQRDRTDWRGRLARLRLRVRRRVAPGWRLVVGIFLILGGLLGFLPILGFWMIPLGIVVAALDVKPLVRRWRGPRR